MTFKACDNCGKLFQWFGNLCFKCTSRNPELYQECQYYILSESMIVGILLEKEEFAYGTVLFSTEKCKDPRVKIPKSEIQERTHSGEWELTKESNAKILWKELV